MVRAWVLMGWQEQIPRAKQMAKSGPVYRRRGSFVSLASVPWWLLPSGAPLLRGSRGQGKGEET